MVPSLSDQKEIYIKKLHKKIRVALAIEEEKIGILCKDWSDWDSLVRYLKYPGEEREFKTTALPDAMFTDGMVDLVVILDPGEKILLFKNYRPDKGFVGLKATGIRREIIKIHRRTRRKPGAVKGTINTPYAPIMFVANPIMDRNYSHRREGTLIMGRCVDQRMLQRFSSYTVEKIQSLDFDQQQLIDFCSKHMKEKKDVHYLETEEKITVFHLLKDINKNPAMLLYTETDNRLFRVMSRHLVSFILITVSLIFSLGLMLYISIDKYLLKRMLAISEQMKKIEGFSALSIRIYTDNKNDEVSYLISDINHSLDRLEQEKIKRENAEKTMIKQGKLASIGRLTSSIAHEISNPLMAISSSVQVIKKVWRGKNQDDPALVREAVEISESEVERIRDIISGLLDFHRLDKEGFSMVNLKDLVLQSMSILNWSKKLDAIEITTELEEDLFIYCSPVKLKQVLINFMDDGPGLPPEVRKSLFEPFVTTKEDKGVGLGLYISYKIIELHDGEIIHNEHYKQGTHFMIRLPRDRRKEERFRLPVLSLRPRP
jgi:signal transduction histidine kinase